MYFHTLHEIQVEITYVPTPKPTAGRIDIRRRRFADNVSISKGGIIVCRDLSTAVRIGRGTIDIRNRRFDEPVITDD